MHNHHLLVAGVRGDLMVPSPPYGFGSATRVRHAAHLLGGAAVLLAVGVVVPLVVVGVAVRTLALSGLVPPAYLPGVLVAITLVVGFAFCAAAVGFAAFFRDQSNAFRNAVLWRVAEVEADLLAEIGQDLPCLREENGAARSA